MSRVPANALTNMNIFMLGWEFPPYISGGLGTACYGLTRGLSELGHRVIFVLPKAVSQDYTTHVSLRTPETARRASASALNKLSGETSTGETPVPPLDSAGDPSSALPGLDRVSIHRLPAILQAYGPKGTRSDVFQTPAWRSILAGRADALSRGLPAGLSAQLLSLLGVGEITEAPDVDEHYGGDMFQQIQRYALLAVRLALTETFDVIHAHDWMTYPAGLAVAAVTGKPLVVHIHSTEFDRSGEHVNQQIYDIERQGMEQADRVIAVSYLTRRILMERYGISSARIDVVYNAIDMNNGQALPPPAIRRDEKIVLFLGRITMQKGPEYFLMAAKRVLEIEDNVRFVMAGSGDMIQRSIELAAHLGIGHKVMFTGFLRGRDVARVFKMADLYVMPSVSEPFGIAPLEALSHDVPVLISKQSGVSEVLTHVLKVDFWDVDEMANKIVAVLRHPPLQRTLRQHGSFEVRRLTWPGAAGDCVQSYGKAIART